MAVGNTGNSGWRLAVGSCGNSPCPPALGLECKVFFYRMLCRIDHERCEYCVAGVGWCVASRWRRAAVAVRWEKCIIIAAEVAKNLLCSCMQPRWHLTFPSLGGGHSTAAPRRRCLPPNATPCGGNARIPHDGAATAAAAAAAIYTTPSRRTRLPCSSEKRSDRSQPLSRCSALRDNDVRPCESVKSAQLKPVPHRTVRPCCVPI